MGLFLGWNIDEGQAFITERVNDREKEPHIEAVFLADVANRLIAKSQGYAKTIDDRYQQVVAMNGIGKLGLASEQFHSR